MLSSTFHTCTTFVLHKLIVTDLNIALHAGGLVLVGGIYWVVNMGENN